VSAVEQALKAAGDITVFPEPVPTAAAAAATLGCEVGVIANSLVFETDGDALLVLASGARLPPRSYCTAPAVRASVGS
jgi:prolyl-tRNA editing enzyme YbaK/EbsC (Cys-tRNA(Pro) deacylase)